MKKILIILMIFATNIAARSISFNNKTNSPLNVNVEGASQICSKVFTLQANENKKIDFGACPSPRSISIYQLSNPTNNAEWEGLMGADPVFNFNMQNGKLTITKG